jgi:hypothetical protein
VDLVASIHFVASSWEAVSRGWIQSAEVVVGLLQSTMKVMTLRRRGDKDRRSLRNIVLVDGSICNI